MAGDDEALEAERRHRLDLVEGQSALRISRIVGTRGRLRAVAIAAQVGHDHRELVGETRRQPAPHQMGLRVAVQQQERRPAAAGHQVDVGARGHDPTAVEAWEEFGHVCPPPPPGATPDVGDATMCSSTRRTPGMFSAATRNVSLSSLGCSSENQRCTTRSRTMMSADEISTHFLPCNSARSWSPIARSLGSAMVVGALFVVARARTRFARLTMPTSLPSQTTGTRLIRFVSSNIAISASSVVSVTETTSRVM